MRRMRKMSAHILILKSKAMEMSSERFRSVKRNENIFVWKCHNQHSCALRTAWEKNWRPCQMHSTPASVIFITYGFDWFLKVIECEMCILKLYWILPCCNRPLWCSLFHLWNKLIKLSNHKESDGSVTFISSPRQFQIISYLSLTSFWNKRRAVPVWKRQWGKSVCLWVDSLICTEHATKPSQVLVYHYEIIGGIRLPSLCSLTMAHYASAVRSISKWPTSSQEIMQSTWPTQKVATLEREPETMRKKKRRQLEKRHGI